MPAECCHCPAFPWSLLTESPASQASSSGGETDKRESTDKPEQVGQSAQAAKPRSASASRIPRGRSVKAGQPQHSTDSDDAPAPPAAGNRRRRAIKPAVPRQPGRPVARGRSVGAPAKAEQDDSADPAVEQRSRANLVRALQLLRGIKAVIEGLPEGEEEVVPSPGRGAVEECAGPATPITQVMSKIDTAYKEAHGAALSLRSNMETALQTVATMQLPPDGSRGSVDLAVWMKVRLPHMPQFRVWHVFVMRVLH